MIVYQDLRNWGPSRSRISVLVLGILSALILALTLGWLLGTADLDHREALILLNFLLLSSSIVWLVLSRQFDLFHPLVIFVLAMGLMFVLRPISVIANGMFIHLGYDIAGTLEYALFVSAIGVSAALCGYSLPVGEFLANRSKPITRHWNAPFLSFSAICMVALGFVLFGLFIVQIGGFQALVWLWQGRESGQDALYRSSTGYFYQGLLLLIPASILLVGNGIVTKSSFTLLMGLITALPVAIFYVGAGGRLFLMILFGGMFSAVYLIRDRRPGLIRVGVMSYIAFTVGVGFIGQARVTDQRSSGRWSILMDSIRHPIEGLDRLLQGPDAEMVDTLANLVRVVPDQLGFQHGGILMDPIIRAVPRLLWSGKPLGMNDTFINEIWSDRYERQRQSAASSILGQLYLDSGLISVILGMLILGIFMRFMWCWRSRWKSDPSVQLIYASMLPFLVVLLRGNLTNTLSMGAFVFVPLLIALRLGNSNYATGGKIKV